MVDETGLAGAYSFDLNFSIRENDDLPQIWAALEEQLGLRLAAKRAGVEVLIVDHIEKPESN